MVFGVAYIIIIVRISSKNEWLSIKMMNAPVQEGIKKRTPTPYNPIPKCTSCQKPKPSRSSKSGVHENTSCLEKGTVRSKKS
jgi:hypothetical protein